MQAGEGICNEEPASARIVSVKAIARVPGGTQVSFGLFKAGSALLKAGFGLLWAQTALRD
jgi:hypothetical protein